MPKRKQREIARDALERGASDSRVLADDKPFNTATSNSVIEALEGGFQINPKTGFAEPAKTVVTVTLRDDPLGRLHKRSHISEADFSAGHWLQAQFEILGRATLRAVDISRSFVDVQYGSHDSISGAQQRAAKNIIKARGVLGQPGFVLCREVLCERKFIEQVASERGLKSQRDVHYLARHFRDCLHTLAHAFGFVARGDRIPTPKDSHRDDADALANATLRHAMIMAGADLKPDPTHRVGGDVLRCGGLMMSK